MGTRHLGVSDTDRGPDPEETLARLNTFIIALVGRKARYSPNFAPPEVFDLEIDEMVQRVRYKLWKALQEKHIEYPEAYIRIIVRNEFNDLSRKRKQPLPLLINDDGELYLDDAKEHEEVWTTDPADKFEESESMEELMDSTAAALARLSPRQQQAMICELNEKIGVTLQFFQALHKHRIEIKTVDWPEDEAAKKLLKASLSPARHKLAESLGFDLEAGKKKITQHIGTWQSVQAQWDVLDVVQQHRLFSTGENEPPFLDQSDGELPFEGTNNVAGLEAYVNKLREPYRTAVELHYVKKRTYPQISSELNLPKGTVKSHISRGMKTLRELLKRKDAGLDLNGEPEAESVEDFAKILARLNGLAEPYRTAVELHYVKKQTYPQMASQLNLSKGTVKSHVSRGMRMLRQLI